MRINVIGCDTVGKAQEFLLKKLGHEVFVFDPYVFPNIVALQTKVDFSFLCTPRDFVVGAVKSAKLVSNAFCCALIMFWNKADYLIKRLELDNSEVARLVCADSRMPEHGKSKLGQPYRGKLVPTCMHELINAFCRKGLNPMLPETVRTYSLRIEKRHANT
jgi:UDP-glucose 6-dehydrogenase